MIGASVIGRTVHEDQQLVRRGIIEAIGKLLAVSSGVSEEWRQIGVGHWLQRGKAENVVFFRLRTRRSRYHGHGNTDDRHHHCNEDSHSEQKSQRFLRLPIKRSRTQRSQQQTWLLTPGECRCRSATGPAGCPDTRLDNGKPMAGPAVLLRLQEASRDRSDRSSRQCGRSIPHAGPPHIGRPE